MSDHIPELDCEAILKKHRIEVTPIRIDVLRTVHRLSPGTFTINQVCETLIEQGVPQKRNTIEYTLRLFKARNIIGHSNSRTTTRRERNEIKMAFILFGIARTYKAI